MSSKYVKVLFDLEKVDDYPTCEVESTWAVKIAGDRFRIDNIPFYVRGVALGDVVRAKPIGDGAMQFLAMAKTAGHSTLRIVFFVDDVKERFCKRLEALGCQWEAHEPSLIAVDVPPSADLAAMLNLLAEGAKQDLLDYEEGVIRA